MIIDEEGDGEFVSKPHEQKNKLRRSRRSLENEEDDGRKKMASRAIEDGDDVTNPKSAVAEPSRRGKQPLMFSILSRQKTLNA